MTEGRCSWKRRCLRAACKITSVLFRHLQGITEGHACARQRARASLLSLNRQTRREKNSPVAIVYPNKCHRRCSRNHSLPLFCKCKCQHGFGAGRLKRRLSLTLGSHACLIRCHGTKERAPSQETTPGPAFCSIRGSGVSAGVAALNPPSSRRRLPQASVSCPRSLGGGVAVKPPLHNIGTSAAFPEGRQPHLFIIQEQNFKKVSLPHFRWRDEMKVTDGVKQRPSLRLLLDTQTFCSQICTSRPQTL